MVFTVVSIQNNLVLNPILSTYILVVPFTWLVHGSHTTGDHRMHLMSAEQT